MRIAVLCLVLCFGAGTVTGWGQSGKDGKPEIVARWHFVGTKQLSTKKGLDTLRDVLALPQSLELRNLAADELALRVAGRFSQSPDTNSHARVAALIKPLLPDLVENESSFELSTRGPQDADWALVVKLPAPRLEPWSKNFQELAASGQMQIKMTDGSRAWQAERDNYHFSFLPLDEWLILEGGSGVPQGAKLLRSKLTKMLSKEVLTADLNLPAIGRIWGVEAAAHAPRLNLAVTPRDGNLRSEMEIEYPQSLNIKPERWNPPVDLINDPLIGFTAIQGISDRLSKSPAFRDLGAEKTPNQAYLWSQSPMAFTVFAAADVGNPGTVISNIVSTYLPRLKDSAGRFNVLTNRPGIVWRGLPIVVPFIEAADQGRSPYLLGGLFPIASAKPKPAPPELFAQLKKKNLVYYDWEITQERVKQWRATWQFAQIIQGKMFPASVSDRWIDAVMPLLGNTITEVTLEKKNKLKLVRTSQTGFAALELVLLAHLLDPNDVREPSRRPPGQLPPPRRGNAPTPGPKR